MEGERGMGDLGRGGLLHELEEVGGGLHRLRYLLRHGRLRSSAAARRRSHLLRRRRRRTRQPQNNSRPSPINCNMGHVGYPSMDPFAIGKISEVSGAKLSIPLEL